MSEIKKVVFLQPFSFSEEQLSHLLLIWPIYLENFIKSKKKLMTDILYLPFEQKQKNINIKVINDVKDFDLDLFYEQMHKLISNLKFEISNDTLICISASFSTLHIPTTIVAEYFQRSFPSSIIVIGGTHISTYPSSYIEKNSIADFLVLGEGEQALAEIINQNPKKQHTPIVMYGRPVINLDELPPIDFTLVDKYSDLFKELSISLSRGCPYDCHFCCEKYLSDNNLGIKRWRSYSPKRAIEETRAMINYGISHGISDFGFVDPVFGLKKSWLSKFLDLYSLEDEYIKWCETRLDLMTEDIIKRFESKKILVMYGVESFSTEQLLRLNKTHSPKAYLEKFNENLNIHKGLKNLFAINILLGTPGEDSFSMNETFNKLEEIISKDNVNNVYFNIRYYHHFPFSELYNNISYFKKHYGAFAYPPSIEWWASTNLKVQKYGPYCLKPSQELSLRKSLKLYTEKYISLIQIEIDKLKQSKDKNIIVKALMLKKEITSLIKNRDELLKFLDENNVEKEEL